MAWLARSRSARARNTQPTRTPQFRHCAASPLAGRDVSLPGFTSSARRFTYSIAPCFFASGSHLFRQASCTRRTMPGQRRAAAGVPPRPAPVCERWGARVNGSAGSAGDMTTIGCDIGNLTGCDIPSDRRDSGLLAMARSPRPRSTLAGPAAPKGPGGFGEGTDAARLRRLATSAFGRHWTATRAACT